MKYCLFISSVFVFASVMCWIYEARRTVVFFSLLVAAAYFAIPFLYALGIQGVSTAILLAVLQWQRSFYYSDGNDDKS